MAVDLRIMCSMSPSFKSCIFEKKVVRFFFRANRDMYEFDPYGISHVFEKTPSPRSFITFELVEIIENGQKCWKEEIKHYKILENGKDWAF